MTPVGSGWLTHLVPPSIERTAATAGVVSFAAVELAAVCEPTASQIEAVGQAIASRAPTSVRELCAHPSCSAVCGAERVGVRRSVAGRHPSRFVAAKRDAAADCVARSDSLARRSRWAGYAGQPGDIGGELLTADPMRPAVCGANGYRTSGGGVDLTDGLANRDRRAREPREVLL